jgi:hypothetical protein
MSELVRIAPEGWSCPMCGATDDHVTERLQVGHQTRWGSFEFPPTVLCTIDARYWECDVCKEQWLDHEQIEQQERQMNVQIMAETGIDWLADAAKRRAGHGGP